MHNMEVITTTDKAQRDRMFADLRQNGNELERQVVKFSSNEPVLGPDGEPDGYWKVYEKTGFPQWRPAFVSTWSVAYPRRADEHPTPRRARRDAKLSQSVSGPLKMNLKGDE